MKNKLILLVLLSTLVALPLTAQVKREQRGVWMSAYVNDWPSGAITETNKMQMRVACQRMLDTLAANNMNVVYFHVRAMADAMYNSAYEPWSSYVSGKRGVAPAFDPLEFIVAEAHKRGIELYAWVNPYRYGPKTNLWGDSPLDYINTHPDWLLTTSYETVLNPGIPEVRQRVVDVCRDIITKYDVDGLVFDDYFYNQGGSSFTLDSALYNNYRRAGGTMSQGDWRRDNVNQMVADVNAMIKSTKSWVRFGIGPAGVCCTSLAQAAQYGVEPSPGSDWQYNQIYSDPMAWISRGTIDFMSPQIYWNTSGNFDEVTEWWGKIGKKFNRHVYVSQTCSSFNNTGWDLDEFVKQVRIMRNSMLSGNPGMIYFKYTTWRNSNGTVDRRVWPLRQYLKKLVYTTPALSPSTAWLQPDHQYGAVQNLKLENNVLSWDSIPNVRYVVYAIPDSVSDAQFRGQSQYMLGFFYDHSYELKPDYRKGYRFAVSILDRWENEYAPLLVGAVATQAEKPVLVSPQEGATVSDMGALTWTGNGTSYTVQVFADAALQQLVANVSVDSAVCPLALVPGLSSGSTYHWRVVARGLNLTDNMSDARSFHYEKMQITSPASGASDVSLTPLFSWTAGAEGTQYTLELGLTPAFTSPAMSFTVTTPSFTIPDYKLSGATTYYARVRASHGSASSVTDEISFTTHDVIPAVPAFVSPSADGAVLYGTSVIAVKPEAGAQSLRVEMSTSTSFPVRTSYRPMITDGFQTIPLGLISSTGKPVDGNTYYVRARYAYYTKATGSTLQFTDYSPVRTFVYRSIQPGDINGDGMVNVSDVTELINMILGTGPSSLEVGDINHDNILNVSDVTELINIILGQ